MRRCRGQWPPPDTLSIVPARHSSPRARLAKAPTEDAVDYEIQRKNMVESQVRPSDVTDRRIIRAMLDLPREQFVPERLKPLAYMDGAVPLISGAGHPRRSLLPPRTLAKLIQA